MTPEEVTASAALGAQLGMQLGVGMQIPGVLIALRETLENHGNDVERAAADPETLRGWGASLPETRSALLLSLAWAARNGALGEDDESHGYGYAAELHRYAREFIGGSELWHGSRYPSMPLPGQAGALASSLGFDREDVPISLKSALLLMAAAPREPAAPAAAAGDDDGYRRYCELCERVEYTPVCPNERTDGYGA